MKDPFEPARLEMIEDQIVSRGIKDENVIRAMKNVPRHLFVNPTMKNRAYIDSALPLSSGQTISQPYIVAFMTEALQLNGDERVLEIGTGSGYQAAVLAEIVQKVFTIERYPELAVKARNLLENMGYNNIIVSSGDGTLGWPKFAPYDRIIVTAGAPEVPIILLDQLTDDGLMVTPVGDKHRQEMQIIRKEGDSYSVIKSIGCLFVPLVGIYGWVNEK